MYLNSSELLIHICMGNTISSKSTVGYPTLTLHTCNNFRSILATTQDLTTSMNTALHHTSIQQCLYQLVIGILHKYSMATYRQPRYGHRTKQAGNLILNGRFKRGQLGHEDIYGTIDTLYPARGV